MCSIEWVGIALCCAFLHGVSGAVQRPWGPVTLLSAIIGEFGNAIGVHNVVDCETSVGQFLAGVFSQEGD